MLTKRLAGIFAAGALAGALAAPAGAAEDKGTLKVAADVGFAPFAMEKPGGGYEGFAIDLAGVLADRLGYDGVEVIDTQWNSIFSGLYAGRYRFIVAPTNITEERAQEMLFTEGYMGTALGFLTRSGDDIESLDDLDGKTVSVNSGSISDTWLTEHKDQYGYEIQRYGKNADAVQAVLTRRAYVNVADLPAVAYVASQQDRVRVTHSVDTGNAFGLPFRKEDGAMRDKVDELLETLKQDGTLAELHKKWFGLAPDPGTPMTMVAVGHGQPGMPGYELEFDQ